VKEGAVDLTGILKNLIEDKYLESYPLFKEFCLMKEKGLRKEAFKSLTLFIKEVGKWPMEQKREFVQWLFTWFEESEDLHHVLVHPLEQNMIKPILEDWMSEETEDPRPFRWHGLFLHSEHHLTNLETALRLGGTSEQRVLMAIIDYYLNYLEFSFHHISEDAYLGEIADDQEAILKLKTLSVTIANEKTKQNVYESIHYYQNLLNDWIAFSSKGEKGFIKWCADHGREYRWSNSYYYE
jgi:hypothetical protein